MERASHEFFTTLQETRYPKSDVGKRGFRFKPLPNTNVEADGKTANAFYIKFKNDRWVDHISAAYFSDYLAEKSIFTSMFSAGMRHTGTVSSRFFNPGR